MSASGETPTSASSGAIGYPIQVAFPARFPPTSFETQVRVMTRSIGVRATRSSQVRVSSRATMPWIRNRHWSVVSCGTRRAVSMR